MLFYHACRYNRHKLSEVNGYMQKQNSGHHPSSVTHQKTQASSTLNRKYVKRPVAKTIKNTSEAYSEKLKKRQELAEKMNRERLIAMKKGQVRTNSPNVKVRINRKEIPDVPPQEHPFQTIAKNKKKAANSTPLTAKERKDRAIQQALRSVATMQTQPPEIAEKKSSKGKKFALAFSCSAIAVAVLGLLVYVNMPNISVQVAAIQSGISDPYPKYIPQEYSLKSATSEQDGKIILEFNNAENSSFNLSEEKTSWDSTALLNNYVKKEWKDKYSTLREQGVTIYVSENGSACWVNGGILYKLQPNGNMLSKKQIRDIATSL